MIKQVFFDFDGVLTTDKTGSLTSCKYLSEKTGIDIQDLLKKVKQFEEEVDSGKMSEIDLWELICKEAGVEFNPNWLKQSYISTPIDEKMLHYAMELKNKYRIGIITDNSIERVDEINKEINLANIFQLIIVSEDVKCTKKGTEIFEITAQRANVKAEECIFIDNKQENVDTAIKAGFEGVYFDDEVRDYDSLIKSINEIIKENL